MKNRKTPKLPSSTCLEVFIIAFKKVNIRNISKSKIGTMYLYFFILKTKYVFES